MIGNIRLPEILFIVLIILLLFGARRIPDLMKNLGKGISSFKQGLNDITKDTEAKQPESEKGKNEQTDA
ncbi:MAG: twin-arginine translocase TatA/TatE family subunit [Paludibacter sp.]|nr:twin-arginine translocase TatA/TatE family subunit [Paludibacter sp.]